MAGFLIEYDHACSRVSAIEPRPMMPIVSELYIYPVKSLHGIRVSSTELTDRGFRYDRRWMLVNTHHVAITQRDCPRMAVLQTAIVPNGIQVYHRHHPLRNIIIPFEPQSQEKISVKVWNSITEAAVVSADINQWFSRILHTRCRLVFMPETSRRAIEHREANANAITSFSDAYPVLMLSRGSLNDLNSRLSDPVPVNRFRPNLVIDGVAPYAEDDIQKFNINGITFTSGELCARCVITTIDQDTARKTKEPLRTLATYRLHDNGIWFGHYIYYQGLGKIRVGDPLKVMKLSAPRMFSGRNVVGQKVQTLKSRVANMLGRNKQPNNQ